MTKLKTDTAIILAGGKSSRMGEDKAFIELGGQTLLDRAIEKMSGFFSEIIVVINRGDFADPRIKTVKDRIADRGPLGGILAGLEGSSSPYNFVTACDMPFTNTKLMKLLVGIGEADVVAPRTERGVQPLCAVYSKNCIPRIEHYILEAGRCPISFFKQIKLKCVSRERVSEVDPEMMSFFNINTPQDLKQAGEWLLCESVEAGRAAEDERRRSD